MTIPYTSSTMPHNFEDPDAGKLEHFAEFCDHLDTRRDVKEVFTLSVSYVLQAFQADAVTIYVSEQGKALDLCYGLTADGKLIDDEPWSRLNGLGRLMQQAVQPVVISGYEPDDRLKLGLFLTQRGVVSLIGLPLLPETSALITGVLLVRFNSPHKFLAGEQQLIKLYVSQITRTLEHVSLLDEFRQRDMDMHIVMDTIHMMISTLELDELLKQVAIRLAWVSGMNDCAISAYESDPERLRTLAHYNTLGITTSDNIGREYILDEHPMFSDAIRGNEPFTVHVEDTDLIEDTNSIETTLLQQKGEAILVMLPLKVAEKPIGLIELYGRSHDSSVSTLNMRRLRLLAEQAALALVNARLYQSECEQRALSEALREISLTLSSSLESPEILDVLLDQIAKVVPFDSGCVILVEGDKVRIAAQRGYEFWNDGVQPSFENRLEDIASLHNMAISRRASLIADVQSYAAWVQTGINHVLSWVGAPLIVRDRVLGFLSLDKVDKNFYTSEHAARLEMLAGHASVALWNALAYSEVEQASITDFITGAYNHRYFQQQLRNEIERANRFGQPLSLLMIDIDHFKKINDLYGHLQGDQVLRHLTTRLREELRGVDLLARYGGEEFSILLPGTNTHSLRAVGQRLLQSVSEKLFPLDEKESVSVTVSIGGAAYPEHASDAQSLISLADQALYHAKNTGRNRFWITGEY